MSQQHSKKKLHQLTSLRGIAAWWVVLYHSRLFLNDYVDKDFMIFLSYGYLAVDLFFILSGFVIYLNYHATVINEIPRSVLHFYWNRLARIYPVHVIMLLAYLLLAFVFINFSSSGTAPQTYTTESFLKSLFLIQTWFGSGPLSWNVPSWSISSEWAVYLFFPLIIYFMSRYIASLKMHFSLVLAMIVLLIIVYENQKLYSIGNNILEMAFFRTLVGFILGCVLGSIYVNFYNLLVKYRRVFLLLFLGFLSCFIFYDARDYWFMPASFFCLIAYLSVHVSFITKTLLFGPLVYLGEISYSTYMVHYFAYDLLKAGWVTSSGEVQLIYIIASFIAVLVMSSLMHHIIEMPGQRYFRKKFKM